MKDKIIEVLAIIGIISVYAYGVKTGIQYRDKKDMIEKATKKYSK